jgi:outer membrane protein assembly factor BamB
VETGIADNGEQDASIIVWNGTTFVATPHGRVLAADAGTGNLRWHAPYTPDYVLLFAVNRGVGVADGKVFIATHDCRIGALDAATGKLLWDVQGCLDTSNSWYSPTECSQDVSHYTPRT